MEPNLLKMKEDYDQLLFISEESYKRLSLHLEFRKVKKGKPLKHSGEPEICSRYICQGFVGIYFQIDGDSVLQNIFQGSDTVFDSISYTEEKVTNTEIKAISDVAFFEFPKIRENQVVENFPEFANLGIMINHRIQKRKDEQNAILRLGIKRGYPLLCQLYPGIDQYLHYQDWAELFNTSERTVSRVLSELNRSDP